MMTEMMTEGRGDEFLRELKFHSPVNDLQDSFARIVSISSSGAPKDVAMQTEFPRNKVASEQTTRSGSDGASPAAFDASELTEDDLELIDLRYDQFVAQAELDHLMDEL